MELNQKIFLKCAEELSELSTVILQQINKPHKNKIEKICEEIADVEKYINILKKEINIIKNESS